MPIRAYINVYIAYIDTSLMHDAAQNSYVSLFISVIYIAPLQGCYPPNIMKILFYMTERADILYNYGEWAI